MFPPGMGGRQRRRSKYSLASPGARYACHRLSGGQDHWPPCYHLVITMITTIFTRHHQQYSSMARLTMLSLQQLSKSRQTHQSLGDHCSLIVNIQGSCYNWRIGLPLNAWGEAFPVGVQCLVRSSPSSFYHHFRLSHLLSIMEQDIPAEVQLVVFCWG